MSENFDKPLGSVDPLNEAKPVHINPEPEVIVTASAQVDNEQDFISLDDIGDMPGEDELAGATATLKDEAVSGIPEQFVSVDANPFSEGEIKGRGKIALPSDTFAAVEEVINNLPSVEVADNDEWTQTLRDGYENEVFQGTGYSRFAQPDGLFTNVLKTEGGLSLTGVYAGASKNSGQVLTGERAVLSMMNYMRVGNIFMAPLWNSGFWVSIKPPTESELIDLMHLLRSEKVRTGRATYGLAYSSLTGVTAKYVIEFIKAHIYSTSINAKEIDIGSIEKHIVANDLDSLILAIICSMYPNGFNYSRSCVADPVTCNETVSGIIDPSKLLYVNRRALNDVQLSHMANRRSNSMTLKDVETYQKSLATRNIRVLNYTPDNERSIRFELKTPTLERYVLATDSWITDIELTADRVLSKDSTDTERDILITRHSKSTTMRQYTHYVDNIVYGDNTQVRDQKSLERVLNSLSADDELSKVFNEKVTELINTSTIASVGIPTYDCPSCKRPVRSRQDRPEEYQNLIPLDLLSVFFDLVREKMVLINRR